MMRVKAIYDNGGCTIDRYTVFFEYSKVSLAHEEFPYVGMDEQPIHPQGFCQHGEARMGKHMGKRIRIEDLPEPCQIVVAMEILQL